MTILLLSMAGVLTAALLEARVPAISANAPDMISLACQILAYGVVGAILVDRRPDLPFGWLLAIAGVSQCVLIWAVWGSHAALISGSESPLASWGLTMGALAFLPPALEGLVNSRFPSGRPTGRLGWLLDRAIIVGTVVALLGGFLGDSTITAVYGDGAPQRPFVDGTWLVGVANGTVILVPVVIFLGGLAGIGVIVRFFKATGIERQQLKWRAVGVALALAFFPLAVMEVLPTFLNWIWPFVYVATLVIPVLRYRLWAIDTILHRSAIYGFATTGVLALYAAAVTLTTGLWPSGVSSFVGVAVAAIAFIPARSLSQRLVDRLFYGNRRDPYQVMVDVGHQLSSSGSVVDEMVRAVAESLRLPYVAVRAPAGLLADYGAPSAEVERWPLIHHGLAVGELLAAPRRGEESFDERDRRIIGDLAHQAGAAVQAEVLTSDLALARQRLVEAREEERRRLRRDLHDGLGPLLTGLGLNLDAARAQLANDPDRAAELLTTAKEASGQVISSLREVVYGLRPPALDDLGLGGALRLHTERLADQAGLDLDLRLDDRLELPAAVEVAVLRTVIEAVTNVVRHSEAVHCRVVVERRDTDLVVSVEDDGGATEPWPVGVGLTAMRERTEELGGTFEAGSTERGGRVLATFPRVVADIAERP